MLLISEREVRDLLSMRECISQMRAAFMSLGRNEAINQPRRRLILPTGSVLHQMAASYGRYFGTKIYSANVRHGAHFLFLLYDAATAAPLSIMEANALGQIRTGAASGLATDLLAPPDASTFAIIGSGYQARSQAEAVCAVRPVREIRVWSRTGEHRRKFAEEASRSLGIEVVSVDSAQQAVEGAQILTTATWSKEPVVEAAWVSPGCHVNAVGANMANRRELPANLVTRANPIVVDAIDQARIESGDLLMALSDEDWKSKVVSLAQAVSPGWTRPAPGDITLFKSNGLAVEDVAAAALVYEKAKAERLGADVPILTYS